MDNMTWKVTQDGTIEDIKKHNWVREPNGKALICEGGNQRADATCVGCNVRVFASEILRFFGPPSGCGGLVVADMADGIHAGLFDEEGEGLDYTSHRCYS